MWAIQVGPDLYQVENSPFHTLEINYKDIVVAIAPDESKKPVVQEVYRRGGHRAIQIVFLEDDQSNKDRVLARINALGATYEGARDSLFALDLPPECSFNAVADYLQTEQDAGVLEQRYAAQPQPPGTADSVD